MFFRILHCTWGINTVKIDTTIRQGTKHEIPCEELRFQLLKGSWNSYSSYYNKEVILNGSWALEAQIFDMLNVRDFRLALYEIMQTSGTSTAIRGGGFNVCDLSRRVLKNNIKGEKIKGGNHRRKDEIET